MFLLACGASESSRLLLLSRSNLFPNGLANGSGLVGRYLTLHEAAEAMKIWRAYVDKISGNCYHQHGTVRMGTDPAKFVLNKWCQAHEVENLYAVDGSPFPTATGINPTLTIMANAARVADHLIQQRSPR